jgi:ribosomal protein S4E
MTQAAHTWVANIVAQRGNQYRELLDRREHGLGAKVNEQAEHRLQAVDGVVEVVEGHVQVVLADDFRELDEGLVLQAKEQAQQGKAASRLNVEQQGSISLKNGATYRNVERLKEIEVREDLHQHGDQLLCSR